MQNEYMHLYVGCNTNRGKLVGIKKNIVFIESADKQVAEYDLNERTMPIKLLLRKLRDLTESESSELNTKGINIGRPKGYSFTPDSFTFLLCNSVDLFGLIERGDAIYQKEV